MAGLCGARRAALTTQVGSLFGCSWCKIQERSCLYNRHPLFLVGWGSANLFLMLKTERVKWRASTLRSRLTSVRMRKGHGFLPEAGPKATIAMVSCKDRETTEAVSQRAAERAIRSWDGTRTAFLAALDPGPKHDWVRAALGEPSTDRA